MGGMSRTDWILVAVIVLSAGFVGQRFFFKRADSGVGSAPILHKADQLAPAAPGLASGPVPDVLSPDLKALSQIKSLVDEQWAQVKDAKSIGGRSMKQSPGCSSGGPKREVLGFVVRESARRVATGDLNLNLAFRNLICVEVGATLEILSWDPDLKYPVVERMGSVRVREIYQIPDATIGRLLAMVGMDPSTYESLKQNAFYRVKKSGPEWIMRLTQVASDSGSSSASTAPPKSFPRTVFMTASEASEAVADGSAVLVDVRSAAEFQSGHIEGAINIPYVIPEGNPAEMPKSKLSHATFNISPILDKVRSTKIIVVGKSGGDYRAQFALYEFFRVGFESMGWIYEGYGKKN